MGHDNTTCNCSAFLSFFLSPSSSSKKDKNSREQLFCHWKRVETAGLYVLCASCKHDKTRSDHRAASSTTTTTTTKERTKKEVQTILWTIDVDYYLPTILTVVHMTCRADIHRWFKSLASRFTCILFLYVGNCNKSLHFLRQTCQHGRVHVHTETGTSLAFLFGMR